MKQIIIIMGINAAGKTSTIFQVCKRPCQRINRDITGGDLEGLVEVSADALANGVETVVLDNTYPTKASRASLIKLAKEIGAKIACKLLEKLTTVWHKLLIPEKVMNNFHYCAIASFLSATLPITIGFALRYFR